ncbi:MAG: ferrochelatase [Gammaproteobacteria bacterium]|nr:ferrochelatase [Gammaproteobacteria bacterium]
MKFINESEYNHHQVEKTGVLLTNLGTPDSCDTSGVRRYLREFLWDPRVVEVPRPVWWMVLNFFILTTRPSRSAKAYQKVWTEEGSPLLTITQRQAERLQSALEQSYPDQFEVVMAMRYGNPSIVDGLEKLRKAGVRKVLVFPLYPQYSATTTASTFDAVTTELQHWRWIPELRFINHYHDFNGYISSLEQSVRDYWQEHGKADKLIMSFHGIPKDYLLKGDPYFCECQKTARLLADRLELSESQWQITFQSRLGAKEWLKPYTDKTLESLGKQGLKSVQVICPGFSADCLETLEEIAMENRDTFLDAGGESYQYIPCLNAKDQHIDMMHKLVEQHVQGWDINTPLEQRQSEAGMSSQNAIKLGAEK